MHYRNDENRVLRLALPCLAALIVSASIGTLAMAAASDPQPPRLFPFFHGNGNGLLDAIIYRRHNDDNEGAREARDIVIPEFSAPRVRMDLIIPLLDRDAMAKGKRKRSRTVKPYVVRTIKVKVRRP